MGRKGTHWPELLRREKCISLIFYWACSDQYPTGSEYGTEKANEQGQMPSLRWPPKGTVGFLFSGPIERGKRPWECYRGERAFKVLPIPILLVQGRNVRLRNIIVYLVFKEGSRGGKIWHGDIVERGIVLFKLFGDQKQRVHLGTRSGGKCVGFSRV